MTRRSLESFSVLPRSAGDGALGATGGALGGAGGAAGGTGGELGDTGVGAAGVVTTCGVAESEVMMSSRVIRPPRPVPLIVLRSTLFSRAIFLTSGDA